MHAAELLDVTDPDPLTQVGDLLIECATASDLEAELLARIADALRAEDGR